MTKEEQKFLKESNAIEDIWDDDSLKQAEFAWEFLKKEKELTTESILKTHKILMEHQDLPVNEQGYFRKVPVWVGGREGKPWMAIPELMQQWIMNANDVVRNGQNDNDDFLQTLIKVHHVRYETIHPFTDGNGRTGRMLLNWERLKIGLPLLVILEKEKAKYYDWFK